MSSSSFPTSASAVDQAGDAAILAVHPDIIETHILTRLDGPALASASCASSQLRSLSTEEKLWKDISVSSWPSINNPRVQDLISTFPSGHRSFFSDSFPALSHSRPGRQDNRHRPSTTSEIISAVDIYYKNEVVFSKVEETDTSFSWFRSVPLRVELLGPKETVPTGILHTGGNETCRSHLEENLTLSWILIDPARKRAVNLSSLRPVSVLPHWLTGYMQVRYATILATDHKELESVQCVIMVTCEGKEGGEMHVSEVTMHVEDMDGRLLTGEESLVILDAAMESGRRKKGKMEEERERYEEYVEMKRERRERKQRRERKVDMVCITVGVTILLAFWSFVLFR